MPCNTNCDENEQFCFVKCLGSNNFCYDLECHEFTIYIFSLNFIY